uniref:Acetylserotonin O-methyltransferase n=1 Tax=Marmota marmota marmota TaxID=9994 RepID=A0A8C5YVQ6_MARMA
SGSSDTQVQLPDTLAFPQVLFAACELGLFDLLAEAPGPLDVAAISEGLGASPWGTELLLEACVPLRLLDVDTRGGTARYANSELARAYLTSRSPTGQRAMLRYLGSVGADPLSEPDQRRPAPRSPAERLQFTRGLQEIWSVDGRRVLTAFDLSPFHRICDLGGGAGALAQECACVYPGCHVTVLEVPEVVQTARAHLPLQTEGQVGFREGRFLLGSQGSLQRAPPRSPPDFDGQQGDIPLSSPHGHGHSGSPWPLLPGS